jgi:hypothetical protein
MARKKINPHYYIINEFRLADDDRFWKLHWFGKLDFNLKNLEPLIETTLVPLTNPRINPDDNPPELLQNESYDFRQSRTVYVGVGQLPLFGIGTFFKHGRPVSRPIFTRQEFRNLYIGDRTWRNIKASGSRNVGTDSVTGKELWNYYINFGEYQLYGMNLEAKCLLVNVPPGDPDGVSKLIIPCVELVRFHYANSSEMFREIFNGGANGTPNRIFNASRTIKPDNTGNNGYVQLSKFVRDKDAPLVARMAFNPYALAEANHIYKSMLNSYANKDIRQHIPEARFPFTETRVSLVVHGKVVKSGNERYFLVFWIERCSGSFPFQTFEYERDNSGIKVDVDPRRPYVSWPQPPKVEYITVKDKIEEEVVRSDVEPSPLKKLVEQLLVKKRFTDLEQKNWRKRPKSHSKYQAPPVDETAVVHSEEKTHTLTTAPPGGVSTVTPLSIVDDIQPGAVPESDLIAVGDLGRKDGLYVSLNNPALRASFGLFLRIVAGLNNSGDDITCEVIDVPDRGNSMRRAIPSHFPVRLKGNPLGFSYMKIPDGTKRRRQVMVAEGKYQHDRYFYLMEIEPQPPIKKKKSDIIEKDDPKTFALFLCYWNEKFSRFDEEHLRMILTYGAKHRGVWMNISLDEVPFLGKQKIEHRSKSVSMYISRIKKHLRALI